MTLNKNNNRRRKGMERIYERMEKELDIWKGPIHRRKTHKYVTISHSTTNNRLDHRFL
jgi:hypothetical protein